MRKPNQTSANYTTRQLRLPLEIEKIIDIADPVYSFCEVVDHIDLSRYFVEKGYKTGRPKCDAIRLLKVILFAFMENGSSSLRDIEHLCKNDIRYMYLLDGMKVPTFATFGNFIRDELTTNIEAIFNDINAYIFEKDHVDLEHTYIDGTKLEANANKYTWVWKKSCITNRDRVFAKVSDLIDIINAELIYQGVRIEKREEYAVEYLDEIIAIYKATMSLHPETFISGRGHRKSNEQKHYENLCIFRDRLKNYANHIQICGEVRNSYSKTDHDATFMRIKTDYMGNDQLLPAYNVQAAVCDEYIAVIDAKPYASDMDCFIPLMEKYKKIYGHYPKYPVADAGYGSYNNYLYCEEHGIEKYMKFTMFEKETKDEKYKTNPYRITNFNRDEQGNLVCPNGKKFIYKYDRRIRGNKYGRTEEVYECEDCEGCPYRSECCKRETGNRTARLNRELM